MIVLDIEASGADNGTCGMWQIGAVDMKTGEEFLEESRIDDGDEVDPEALVIFDKTEEELRDKSKQSQKEMLQKFITWMGKFEERVYGGHNIGWDITFMTNKAKRYGIFEEYRKKLGYRGMDIQTIAQLEWKKKYGSWKTKNGKNDMHLTAVLEFCGFEDPRGYIQGGEVIKEGFPHDALGDAKLTAKCFAKLLEIEYNGK